MQAREIIISPKAILIELRIILLICLTFIRYLATTILERLENKINTLKGNRLISKLTIKTKASVIIH